MNALSIRGLKKEYKGGVVALNGIDLDIKEGDFFGLLGPNGAGKTTTLGIITDLVKKTEGKVLVFNHDLDTEKEKAKMLMGVVPQEINMFAWTTVEDLVINQAGYYGIPRKEAIKRAEECLKQVGLWEKRKEHTRALSGGMKRRLMMARALVNKPRLLLLDEPTAGVDVHVRAETWEFLKKINKAGTTIILTTHNLEEAEHLCKNLAVITKGTIVKKLSTKEIISSMEQETFIFDVAQPIKAWPYKQYPLTKIDDTSFEVIIPRHKSINELFTLFSKEKISILSMKNKSNRLEQMLVTLLNEDNP